MSIRDWLLRKLKINGKLPAVSCDELLEAGEEYMIRELAFNVCVSLIANAVGKCEFKTYRGGKEIREGEYYLWNVEPNTNQNSTAFVHKLIYKLYSENEALVISTHHRDGREMLAVADSFVSPLEYPAKMQEYTGVQVGEVAYNKTFRENEVMHFRLQQKNIRPVLNALYGSYNRLTEAAMRNYSWANGKHYKVHVSQIARGSDEWQENFTKMINSQVKPFLENASGVLPEFDGYSYENIGGSPDSSRTTRDIKALVDDIFDFTSRAFGIPTVLLLGDVAGTQDALERWLTTCIDPLCDQIQEEIIRKRYGYEQWRQGNYMRIDTSSILHFDLFANASNIEKLIGSGAFSINDIRRAAGLSEIPEEWADKHFMTLNISTMEQTTRQMEKAKT